MCKDSCKLKCCTDVAHTSNNNRIMKKVVWKFLGCFFLILSFTFSLLTSLIVEKWQVISMSTSSEAIIQMMYCDQGIHQNAEPSEERVL